MANSWWSRPKITPFQILLYTGGIFYFLFISTDFFSGLDDFIKFSCYVGIMLLSYLAGYSAIDSKRLGLQVHRILRDPNKALPEKYEQCFEVIDEVLFHITKEMKKEQKTTNIKNKKKGEK